MFYTPKRFARGFLQTWLDIQNIRREKIIQANVIKLLKSESQRNTEKSEADYHSMCLSYRGPSEYGYDKKSTWLRGIQRAMQITSIIPDIDAGRRSLEVGCGDGMVSLQLSILGMECVVTDLCDWRDERAKHLPFQSCDLGTDNPLPGEDYDLVLSFNAFEHFPNPTTALQRMVAATKPGGYLFFEFGPLYAGPWGLHAYRMLPMPYPQFLFREKFWREKIKESGIRDLGQELDDLQPVNQWTSSQFDKLWRESNCELILKRQNSTKDHLNIVLKYPDAFRGIGLTYEDLTTQSQLVLLRKPISS